MKFVTFLKDTPAARLGALDSEGDVVDLATAATEARLDVLDDMLSLIDGGEPALDVARRALEAAARSKQSAGARVPVHYRRDEVKLLAPLPRPRTFRDFWIFEEHVKTGWRLRGEELPDVWYQLPTYYKGNPMSIIGPEEDLTWPSFTEKLDFELEMGVIIGKKGRDISEDHADDHIFGYTVLNDWSARDIQRKEMQCRLGPAKGKDFATSLGPCIVTPDEVDPYNLRMTARINDEVWSDNNSGTGYWKFNQLIAHVSMGETIYPGELLGTGTVGGGCGLELNRWLQPGDVVELEIEKIGLLRNRVVKG